MAGEELLIVDASDRDREGMRRYFDQRGYVCTAARSGAEARDFLTQKFFPAALVDLDVDGPSGGLEVIRFARERSRETTVVLLTARRSFEGAVGAHRLGVADICLKAPDQVEHLRQVVERAATRYRARDERGELLREMRAVLNESFKVMLEMARRVYADLSTTAPPLRPRVMFVDGDGAFLNELAPLVQAQNWDIITEMSGGAALDRAWRDRVDILVVRNDLPDLGGSMVIKTIQLDKTEVLGLLYTVPGPQGRIDRFERGQVEGSVQPFTSPAQLVAEIQRMSGELATKAHERRLIQAFRNDHSEFLRRYAQLKKQIDVLVDD
jgi:DNA-binding NtrC family response regulator